MSGLDALAGRLRRTLADVELVVGRADALMTKARQTGDDGYLDGVALNLHGFYTGVEQAFEAIGREVDGALPEGPNWHQELLLQMAADLDTVRPAVLTTESRDCLEEYRGFRHVVRNVYAFQLNASRLEDLTQGLRPCYERLHRDVEAFIAVLRQMDGAD